MVYNPSLQSIDEYRKERIISKGQLYDSIANILYTLDPVGIAYFDNVDEYEPEVDTILPRLNSDMTKLEINEIVFEEFMNWFNDGHKTNNNEYGSKDTFEKIANEIWKLLHSEKINS